jgi:hypothetical protein
MNTRNSSSYSSYCMSTEWYRLSPWEGKNFTEVHIQYFLLRQEY